MAKYTLIRHSDGTAIHTDSPHVANDLVANGVAAHAPQRPQRARKHVAPKPEVTATEAAE